jgi:hydrophobe/amphiphile efflux-3 (HAE3) family protein
MWKYIARWILRYRVASLIVIGLITVFFAFQTRSLKLSYELAQMLPEHHPTLKAYKEFKAEFGQDGAVMFAGAVNPNIFQLDQFNALYDLSHDLQKIDGVEGVVSIAQIYTLQKNKAKKKFDFTAVVKTRPKSQHELDSLKNIILSLPFYDGLLYNKDSEVYLVMITLDKNLLNTKERVPLIYSIKGVIEKYASDNKLDIHLSGLPYIRTITSDLIKSELYSFIFYALFVAAFILFIFFRSFKMVLYPVLTVAISVIWTLGITALLGYKITILTGIIPPLLIIIGIENSIFLLNKYIAEYKVHQNKVKALTRMVSRIGSANFLTNATTAAGFAAFIITGNKLLVEFGIVASLNILGIYLLTLILIPILFSFKGTPKKRLLSNVDHGLVSKVVDKILMVVSQYRTRVYILTLALFIASIFGVSKLKTSGNIVDDIPKDDILYQDLLFFEKHFKGVMPFEITIDTKKTHGILKLSTINKIDRLQDVLENYKPLSRPVSLAEVVKFAKQAFYNGSKTKYALPNSQEKNFIMAYMPKIDSGKKNVLNSFVDDNMRKTRISVQMANIGTTEIEDLKSTLRPQIDKIFNPKKFDVKMTGTSVVFLEGTKYLIKNLVQSLLLALIVISLLMALLFTSARMIVLSLIPNLLPQLLTAAMMGYFGISIRPSTILIFSIALGISVDNAIHFLSRYRLHLKQNNWEIKSSVMNALKETGFSMIYSSIVLFFGFYIFTLSKFGGTEAMGYLISFTIFAALLSNLFLLPSILLTLDKFMTTKAFKASVLEVPEPDTEENKK